MNKGIRLIITIGILIFTLFSLSAYAAPLSVDQAFKLTVSHSANKLTFSWQVAPGYRLYRDSIAVHSVNNKALRLGKYALPQGVSRFDALRGDYHAFENIITLKVPIKKHMATACVRVTYQGCKIKGYCYAPQQRIITINFSTSHLISIKSRPPAVVSQTKPHGIIMQCLIFFLLGILLAFTPCVLPMIPILSSIIVGHGKNINSGKAFLLSFIYVIAMSLTYAIAGLLLALLGVSLQSILQAPWAVITFALLFVILAFSLFGAYDIRLPKALENRLLKTSSKQRSGSWLGVFVMGVLSALIVSPCVSAPLVGALAYITDKGSIIMGFASLFCLAFGMGVPLLFVGVATGKVLPKAGHWMQQVKIFFAFVLLGVAINMITRILASNISLILYGILLICAALYYVKPLVMRRWWQYIIIIIVLIYGLLLLLGGLRGHEDLFSPLKPIALAAHFHQVTSVAQLNVQLQQAKRRQQIVMIDYTAQWCVECQRMRLHVLTDKTVRSDLKHIYLIAADVTHNDENAIALKKRYAVLGTPTLVFLDSGGQVLPQFTQVGFVNSMTLRDVLARIRRGNEN